MGIGIIELGWLLGGFSSFQIKSVRAINKIIIVPVGSLRRTGWFKKLYIIFSETANYI